MGMVWMGKGLVKHIIKTRLNLRLAISIAEKIIASVKTSIYGDFKSSPVLIY